MKKFSAATLAIAMLASTLAISPADALGGCGPNRHRNYHGYCVWGGQNQAWCLRHTGHTAYRGPYGTRVCPH
ncbi:MAG: hypothetical protein KGM15_08515 [Pseudomonadota bacterium]|nr:hypothetical protein [Pseudomonadota bacterium]